MHFTLNWRFCQGSVFEIETFGDKACHPAMSFMHGLRDEQLIKDKVSAVDLTFQQTSVF